MPVINTNVNSIVSQNATNRSDRAMTNTMEKLSTGFRINKSGDDAAGLAVSTNCLLYTSPSPRDTERSRMPSSA